MTLRGSVFAASIGLASLSLAARDCTVYHHRDYGGARWGINAGERFAGLQDPGINQTCSHANCQIYWQADWNDQPPRILHPWPDQRFAVKHPR